MFLSCSTLGGLKSTSDDKKFLNDQIETLKKVRAAGYSHIELFMNDRGSGTVDSVVQAVRESRLIPYSIHLPKFLNMYDEQDFENTIDIVFPFIESLGIKVAILHPSMRTILESKSFAVKLDALLTKADEVDCTITIENVPYIKDINKYILKHLQLLDDRPLGVTLDLEFAHLNGSNITQLMDTFNEKLLNVHCRDSDGNLVDDFGNRKYLVPGTGAIDFHSVIGALYDGGYEGPLTIEVSHKIEGNLIESKRLIESVLANLK
ncbi:MAG: sugar phosphate isomerase/epimerase family protein [Candidatus Hodarchaeota archaeon]